MTRALTSDSRVTRYDPARAVYTVRGDDGQLIRCLECGDPLEVLLADAAAYARGHAFPRCAECSGDERVLSVIHPPAALVIRLRAERAQSPNDPHHAGARR